MPEPQRKINELEKQIAVLALKLMGRHGLTQTPGLEISVHANGVLVMKRPISTGDLLNAGKKGQ